MSYTDRDTYGMYAENKKGPGPELMGAGTLSGEEVYNLQNEHLGEIKEIMLDMRSGSVAYAVLSYGSFLGMGETLFAVPWNALTLDTEQKCFRLNVAKDSLADAPGFDQKDWPDMADASWGNKIHTYYGTNPYFDRPL